MKKRYIAAAILPVLFLAGAVSDRIAFRRTDWLADFDQLKSETEQSYANLQWAGPAKHVDIVALNQLAVSALQKARKNSEGRAALASFIDGFNDKHFHVEAGPPKPVAAVMALWPRSTEPRIDFKMTAGEVCEALGYNHKRSFIRIDHPGLNENPRTVFASGTITLEDHVKYGIIRIPGFTQYDYGASCERAWDSYALDHTGLCGVECQDRFYVLAERELAAQLAREATALMKDAPRGVIIDLTGNGGGSEWAEYAAAALTPIRLQKPRVAFVRGDHWAKSLTGALRDSARVRCDVSSIWTNRDVAPACSNVVTMPGEAGGVEADLSQPEPYTGPLIVLVDEGTASAAEYFAAVLQDNRAATIIGSHTMGVGCGYTNGGIDHTLKHSGLKILMPDCARLRADGTNEYAGVRPDVVVDWGASESSKGKALEQALRGLEK